MAKKVVSVKYLQSVQFSSLTKAEKLEVKEITVGRPTPNLKIEQRGANKNYTFTRKFSSDIYEKFNWLCGCEEVNAVFCFPCLWFGGNCAWTKLGVKDLKHIAQKSKKHEESTAHIDNMMSLSLLGRTDIAVELNTGYMLSVARHNDQVRKNIDILSKIINCVKFCGKFEHPLRDHDESTDSDNPGILRDLLILLAS